MANGASTLLTCTGPASRPAPLSRCGSLAGLPPVSSELVTTVSNRRLIAFPRPTRSDRLARVRPRRGSGLCSAILVSWHFPFKGAPKRRANSVRPCAGAPVALVWRPIASRRPVAFELLSAGPLVRRNFVAVRSRGLGFATLTYAAGISPTDDLEIDNLLPFDAPYSIPPATAAATRAAVLATAEPE